MRHAAIVWRHKAIKNQLAAQRLVEGRAASKSLVCYEFFGEPETSQPQLVWCFN